MKKLLKITSVLLIQAFLAVDFAWCGVNAASPGDSATTLSPNLIINDESFHGMVLAKSISFENTGGINKEKILSLRQSPAITKTLLKELIRKKNAIGYMLALLELERQGVDCVREINEGFRELDRINDPRK
ncbi:MAG: hypothetical protein PHO30_05320, partial [Candidatus Omnitrophica bacterium]|nr:hypothetical protein [Candidatus Omnitrophota bacterium]